MNLPLRTYQRFEAGVGGLDLARIHQFADVVEADGWAIVLALELGAPDFALHCMDNKAVSILLLALQRFEAQAGRDIPRLDPRTLLSTFTRAFDELAAKAAKDADYIEQWMFDAALRGDPEEDEG